MLNGARRPCSQATGLMKSRASGTRCDAGGGDQGGDGHRGVDIIERHRRGVDEKGERLDAGGRTRRPVGYLRDADNDWGTEVGHASSSGVHTATPSTRSTTTAVGASSKTTMSRTALATSSALNRGRSL